MRSSQPLMPLRRTKPPAASLRSQARTVDVDHHAPLAVGSVVEIVAGPFSGKVGPVQELDEKLGVKVQLGPAVVWFDRRAVGLRVTTLERPRLRVSHRKPSGVDE